MKLHPTSVEGERRLDERKDIGEFTRLAVQRTSRDQQDAALWLARKTDGYRRRYQYPKESVNRPWVGASNIRIPLIDIHIEEMKPPLLNLTFGGPKIYNMVPLDAVAVERAQAATQAMDYLHKYRMPDYLWQKCLQIDSLGQFGVGVNKVFYDYRTRQTTEVIRKIDMPQSLSSLAVSKDNTPEQMQMAQAMGMTLMTPEQFDQAAPQIAMVVQRAYGLDTDEKIDANALDEIMRFLRNGSRGASLVIKRRAVICDTPRVINVPLEDIIVPQGTRSIEDAERLTHRMFFSEADLLQRSRDEVWDSDAVTLAIDKPTGRSGMGRGGSMGDELYLAKQDRMASMMGANGSSDLFEVWEMYDTWDIDGDGLEERVVLTVEPNSFAVLKAIELPFDHGEWPFVSSFLEATDCSFFGARGIPDKIDDLEAHATALARAEQNNLLIETSRSFIYVENSGINPLAITWMPGLMIPVQNPGDLQPIQMSPSSLALEQPFRNMMGLAERVVTGSSRQWQDGDMPERPASIVGESALARQRVLGVRAQLYQHAQRREGRLVWALWRQYGPDDFYATVAGEAPEKFTQAQIAGDFMVTPAAATGDMDPGYRSQQAWQRLEAATRLAPMLADDPRYEVDIAQAFIDWLYESDLTSARRLVRKRAPQEVQALVQNAQAQTQQLAKYADIAQRLIQAAPVKADEAADILRFMKSQMPHKDLQPIIDTWKLARRGADRFAALANGSPS